MNPSQKTCLRCMQTFFGLRKAASLRRDLRGRREDLSFYYMLTDVLNLSSIHPFFSMLFIRKMAMNREKSFGGLLLWLSSRCNPRRRPFKAGQLDFSAVQRMLAESYQTDL